MLIEMTYPKYIQIDIFIYKLIPSYIMTKVHLMKEGMFYINYTICGLKFETKNIQIEGMERTFMQIPINERCLVCTWYR